MSQHTKAKVIAINGAFTGSVVKIMCASASNDYGEPILPLVLDAVAFGTFINDGSATGSGKAIQDYAGEINIFQGEALEGPIQYFHVKNGTHSPAVVYYTDEA